MVQGMNFIASTLGRGSATQERVVSQVSRAQGKAARVFIGYGWGWGKSVLESRGRFSLGTAGGVKKVGRTGFGFPPRFWFKSWRESRLSWWESQPSWAS